MTTTFTDYNIFLSLYLQDELGNFLYHPWESGQQAGQELLH